MKRQLNFSTLWVFIFAVCFLYFPAETIAQTYTVDYYSVKSGSGKGLRVWNADYYKIHMETGSNYKYGPVQDYSIKMNMNNDDIKLCTRGRFAQQCAENIDSFGSNDLWSSLVKAFALAGIPVPNIYGLFNVWGDNSFTSGIKDGQHGVISWGGPNARLDFDFLNGAVLSTKMSILSNGNVGIGTHAPKGTLQVGQQLVITMPHTNGGWGGIAKNMYWSGVLKRIVNSQCGDIIFRTAGAGAANSAVVVQHIMRVHNNKGVTIKTDYLPSNVKLNVNGNVQAHAYWQGSDRRFKKDIKTIENALDKVNELEGLTYQYKIGKVGDYEFKDLEGKDQLGFVVQDLKAVFPELVKEDENGYHSVNYVGLIPVLVEALKEQQNIVAEKTSQIENQQQVIDNLVERMKKLEALVLQEKKVERSIPETIDTNVQNAILKQNVPNPFTNKTAIAYQLPKTVEQAALTIFDLTGNTISTFQITGKGTVELKAGTLQAGTYIYSIIANGQTLASKKMIIK